MGVSDLEQIDALIEGMPLESKLLFLALRELTKQQSEQLAKQTVGVEPAGDRAGDDTDGQQWQNGGQTQPPGQPLRADPDQQDGGDRQRNEVVHTVSQVVDWEGIERNRLGASHAESCMEFERNIHARNQQERCLFLMTNRFRGTRKLSRASPVYCGFSLMTTMS